MEKEGQKENTQEEEQDEDPPLDNIFTMGLRNGERVVLCLTANQFDRIMRPMVPDMGSDQVRNIYVLAIWNSQSQ